MDADYKKDGLEQIFKNVFGDNIDFIHYDKYSKYDINKKYLEK
jgi:hypothetical protein